MVRGHHGVFAVGSHRNLHLAALQQLQHTLLHRLAADIPLIGIFLLGNLIDLINKNNPVLSPLHIIVRCGQQLGNYALNIIADISGFCQGGSVCNGQGHVQQTGQGLYKISFPGTGGAIISMLDFSISTSSPGSENTLL